MNRIGYCVVTYNREQQIYKIYVNNEFIVSCHTELSMKSKCDIINKSIEIWRKAEKATQ